MRQTLAWFGWFALSSFVIGCGDDAVALPCDPNPCTVANRTACFEVGDAEHLCACGGGFIDDGNGGCDPIVTTADGTGVDWSESDPKYTGRFRVVDKFGKGVANATVRKENLQVTTDATGRAKFPELAAESENTMHVEALGHVPHVKSLGFDDAGQKEANFVMTPLGPTVEIDPSKHNVIQTPSIAIAIPTDSLMDQSGAKPSNKANVSATSIDHKTPGADAVPGLALAVDGKGRRAPMRKVHAVLHLQIKDDNDQELVLRPGKEVTASFALPEDSKLQVGDTLGLFALNATTGRWSKESSCRVEEGKADPRKSSDRTLDCIGAVPHFSTWAVGEEWDIYTPGQVGCINASVRWNLPSGVTASRVSWNILECEAGQCAEGLWRGGEVKYVPPLVTTDPHSLCGVVGAAGQSYRWVIEVDLEVAATAGIAQPSGRYYFTQDFAAPPSFSSIIGADLALNQELDAITECRMLCDQQTLDLDLAALGDAAYVDTDGDGWYALASGTTQAMGIQADCDDGNPDVHPGAPDSLCTGVDNDCDGDLLATSGGVSWNDVSDPFQFNHYCGQACVTVETEVAGNLFDENCDGKVDDVDGDGVKAEDGDCDDWNPAVNATATEVVGNSYDDNCDGETLDRDSDGYFAWQHERFATELGLDPVADPERFNDCLDSDLDTNPGVPIGAEVGQLGGLYYVNSLSEVRRSAGFCDYFDVGGNPSSIFSVFRDRNCDGVVSDLDGDGFTTPGDVALGVDNAIDCNDLDLRVIPTPADMLAGTPATCVTPDASLLINDSECTVDLSKFGGGDLAASDPNGCPTRLGGFIETNCWEIDAVNGLNLCLYLGWDTQLPLKWRAGVLWGACDETGGGLPDCPTGSACAGPIAYTPEYTQYLTDRYMTPPLSTNMCFKSCDNPIGSLASMP